MIYLYPKVVSLSYVVCHLAVGNCSIHWLYHTDSRLAPKCSTVFLVSEIDIVQNEKSEHLQMRRNQISFCIN